MSTTAIKKAVRLLIVSSMLLTSVIARPQLTSADVVGNVTDSNGGALVGARVVIENQGTGDTRSKQTDESGDFVFNLLPIGRYNIRIEATGFKTFAVPDVMLSGGDRRRVDVRMQVGQVTEAVEVMAENAILQTDSSALGTAITGRLVQELPLNGRNYIHLAHLVPGVSPGPLNALSSGTRPDDRRQSSTFSVDGQDPVVNNNMIDGMDNNERVIGTIGIRPSIDAIAEFKVQTNLYNAEIGRTSGGVVNILTKSGTNKFHGSAFEFLRNDKFDANANYNFTGGAQLPKQKYRQNQFGGSLGGPIVKDKTFFFGDYEALRIVQGVPLTATVPTAKQRVGDFSEICTAGFNAAGICANSLQQLSFINAIGGVPPGAVPFNRLDVAPYKSLIDPVASTIAAMYPQRTGPGLNITNFAASPIKTQNGTTFDVRVDHRLTPNTNFFGRYSFNDVTTFVPTGFPDVNGINPGGNFGGSFPGPNKTRAQNLQMNIIRVLGSNLLLELKVGYLRAAIQSFPVNAGKAAANQLGFACNGTNCVNNGDVQTFGLPQMNIQGFQGLGDPTFIPLLQFDNTFQYNAALDYTRGAHNIKTGLGLIRRQFTIVQSVSARGSFTFNASTPSAPARLNNGLANFLLGTPITISRNASLVSPGYRSWEPSGYIHDDWHAKSWLTLNIGVRYEVFTPKVEVADRISNFDPATGLILIPGLNSSRSAGVKTDYGNVSPRLGFAATLGHGTVVRGGFGLSYYPGDYTSGAALKNVPFTTSFTCGPSTTGSLINTGCPAGIGSLSQGVPLPETGFSTISTPAGVTLDLSKIPPTNLRMVDLNFQASYLEQFNLTLEKQFGNNVLSVGYVGQVGRDLVMDIGINGSGINQALPSGTSTPNRRPFAGIVPTVTGIEIYTTSGRSNYNAFQLSLQRRFHQGLTFTSGYTFAHGTDNITGLGTSTGGYGNLVGPLPEGISNVARYDHGTSDFNVKHRWTFGANYELPFGKSLTGVPSQLISGWQVNGIATWQTGLPFTVTDQTAVSGIIGVGAERPNLVKREIVVSNPTVGSAGQWLDPTAFQLPASFTLGNAPRNIGHGPRQGVVNLSLFKNFRLSEAFKLQCRAEAFNLLNHPIFGNPNTQFGNAGFGKITTLAGQPRQLQFAMKLLF